VAADCLICEKHAGRGPLVGPVVWEDRDVLVSHRPADPDGRGFLGYLFVESRRHVARWDELTSGEAESVARTAWLAARALRAELPVELVFSAIVGMNVHHFHQHIFVRYPGTPSDVDWMASLSWDGAPRSNIDALAARLGQHFGRE
jgi:ATP adenylyltransferase